MKMSRDEKIKRMICWAMYDLDNDTDSLDEYEKKINSFDDKTLDAEYDATVG
jgi:hypothetical protein